MKPKNKYQSAFQTYSRASLAYQSDCNKRPLKKPDAKRLRLQKASNDALKIVMGLLRDFILKEQQMVAHTLQPRNHEIWR